MIAATADLRTLEGREVWFFSAVPWDFALGGSTRALALGLLALGARVTFVEPPSIKKTLGRLRAPHDAPSDITVIGVPPSVPKISDSLPLVPTIHDAAQRLWLRALLGDLRPTAIVSTPRWAPVLDGLAFSSVWYHCLDDLRVHAPDALLEQFERWDRALIARARGTFAVTPALAESLERQGARNVSVVGNAVSFDEFRRRSYPPDPKGDRKRIGYLGALYEWVDFELLVQAARALPEHEFCLVGPVRRGIDVTALERLPNVMLLGYRPYAEVPRAMASFDVGLIPFKEGVVARAADPLKVYEYFCFGTPVVTTPVGDLESLGELLYVASGPEAFVEAIRAAVSDERPQVRRRRIAYARANDWSERAKAVAQMLVRYG